MPKSLGNGQDHLAVFLLSFGVIYLVIPCWPSLWTMTYCQNPQTDSLSLYFSLHSSHLRHPVGFKPGWVTCMSLHPASALAQPLWKHPSSQKMWPRGTYSPRTAALVCWQDDRSSSVLSHVPPSPNSRAWVYSQPGAQGRQLHLWTHPLCI